MIETVFIDDVFLDRTLKESLSSQLSRELRRLILAETLETGRRLPSSRAVSHQLHIARNVVTEAYETLISEGLLRTRHGAGTFIVENGTRQITKLNGAVALPRLVSKVKDQLCAAELWSMPDSALAFTPGVPDLKGFPKAIWARSVARAVRYPADEYLTNADPQGLLALRTAIAGHVGPARKIACHPDQVVILSSARQGFELATRLFVGHGETVLIEDPGYVEAREIARGLGRHVQGCPITSDGLVVPQDYPAQTRALLLTPTHQYPTGVRMTPDKMGEILSWAESHNILIVEDDYDGEFRHDGKPTPALMGLRDSNHVIHIGTFSKSLFPGLRLAYLMMFCGNRSCRCVDLWMASQALCFRRDWRNS